EAIEARLSRIWCEVLDVAAVDPRAGFFDIGGDSVSAVLLAEQIAAQFGCEFPVTEVFRFGSVRRISEALAATQSVGARFDAAVPAAAPSRPAAAPAPATDSYAGCIAIIGLACHFPGARHHEQFWENLVNGVDSIAVAPPAARDAAPARPGAHSVYAWGNIEGKEFFDAEFFQVAARDAHLMDPQLRLLLQQAWAAVEDAGYVPGEIPDTGVFTASSHNDYATLLSRGLAADSGMLTDSDQYVAWLLSQSGTIPTMISHRLGLTGPSLAVHSNCSSSLVAMHTAQRSVLAGESRQAIVGAATVSGTTLHGYVHLKGLNFSRDGRVKTFDADADGMVGAEGVAAVLLKRASDAIADGDHVYALLRGIAINNDGAQKAGFYSPSVDGQERLIQGLLASSGVHPDSIGYVEAHGTGTELGDPIEVAALTAAWRRQTSAVQYCGIGSVKTNLGHLDTAAGLAGCIKVALSLSRRQLPPSLHYHSANPRLNLDTSPFYVVDRLRTWPEQPHPRRAALSSFGIGGTNAHALFEEYRPPSEPVVTAPGSYLLVLSAKSAAQVDAYAGRMREFLQRSERRGEPVDLAALTYTLQVGRVPMEHRLAVVFTGLDDLRGKLDACVAGQWPIAGCYRGTASDDSQVLKSFAADEDLQTALRNWVAKGKHQTLAELWVQGAQIDWRGLPAQRPRRMSLPTYPFKQQHFWVDKPAASGAVAPARAGAVPSVDTLHPLLHRNTSTLSQQRFSSRFAGDEHFLRDHVVEGTAVMPGVAYLEMVRAALRESDDGHADASTFRLRNVVWLRPLRVGAPRQVHVSLNALESGDCDYEVSSTEDGPAGEALDRLVHGMGRAVVGAERDDAMPLDLDDLRRRLDREIEPEALYRQFEAMQIHYGPAHVVITDLKVGTDGDAHRYVLASLRLPSAVAHTAADYVLHPSLLDGALQAIIGLAVDALSSPAHVAHPRPHLPFALEELDVFRAIPADAVACCRLQPSVTSDNLRKYDVDVCDSNGEICVRVRGFATRAMQDAPLPESTAGAVNAQFLAPTWSVRKALFDDAPPNHAGVVIVGGDAQQQQSVRALYPAAHVVDVSGGLSVDDWRDQLQALGTLQHVVWLPRLGAGAHADDETLLAAQEADVISAFRLVKALLQLDYGSSRLRWTMVTRSAQEVRSGEPVDPAQAALHGFVGSLAREYAHWPIRLADVGTDGDWPLDDIARLPADAEGEAWAYRDGQWYRRQLLVCDLSAAPVVAPYRQGGVYVVIGGAGGIGEVFTRHLLTHYRANVVWIGRREADEAIEAKRRDLAQLGPAPLYVRADAADAHALEQAWQQIKARYGRIDGIVHAAIVLMDKSLAGMGEDVFRAALRAKAETSVRLAQIAERESLDFVAFFSSLQSFSPAAGQSNYSAGCTFADAFATLLSRRMSCPVKVMNWGYWGSVGVVASEAYRQRLAKIGLDSIEPEAGMNALDRLLGSQVRQLAFVRTSAALQARRSRLDEEIVAVGSVVVDVTRRLVVPQTLASPGLDAMVEAMRGMEDLLARVLVSHLDELGLLGETMPAAYSAMPAPLRQWLAASRRAFVELGLLRQQGSACEVIGGLDARQVRQQWQDAKARWAQDPHVQAHASLADAALTALPDILSGSVPATDVFFPGASVEQVGALYRNNPVADYFNDVLVETLSAAIVARLREDPSARLRLIEIGAGTGGASASIFARLAQYRDHIEEYCYTDISKAFLFHARQNYAPIAPYLQCRLFDAQRPPAEQGIASGVYDIAIAVNVLHVAGDIRQAVRNVKATLQHNGLLLLNEISTWSLFAHATFGLLDGWWQFVDAPLRIDGTPGLSPESWRQLLVDEGFRAPGFPAHAQHPLGQQIVIAASDGMVRRPAAALPVRRVEPDAPASTVALPAVPAAADLAVTLRDRVTLALRKLVAETVQMSLAEIDAAEPMEKYGIDSILVVRMSGAMNAFFDDIRTTLFFEHRTIAALAAHLLANRREQAARWVGMDETSAVSRAVAATPTVRAPAAALRPNRLPRRSSEQAASVQQHPQAPVPGAVSGIAVIGLAGRYAQASDIEEFWSALVQGKNCIGEVPAERWDWRTYFNAERGRPGSIYSRWGGFLDAIDLFDPLFFDISPLQAEYMDPQERLFLEEAYACIEDAGYTPASLSPTRRVGVYVGAMNNTYMRVTGFYSIANRVSYLFDFQGPSMAVDTACSASLTAIHLAVEALRSGSCDRAIAGGVNLIVDPVHYQALSAQTMLSSGDRCRSFGDDADGFVDGEGVGAVVLKPLAAAIDDGDHIYGVIRGSMVNAGGRTHGYTVPNPAAQTQVVVEALSRAGVRARAVSYIEAHGTGTQLGDPIEVAALTAAFRKDTADLGFCAIGSLKSNIGHAESAAGIAGLTKVLLQMRHRQLVPSLHVEVLNPQIDFGPFVVQRESAPWQRPRLDVDGKIEESPRIAGISSFGAGGANAHLVVEEYEAPAEYDSAPVVDELHPALILLSAKTPEALPLRARRLLAAVERGAFRQQDLAAIAYTLQVGREALRYRLAFTATSLDDLRRKLLACQQGSAHTEEVHRGESASQRGVDGLFAGDEEMQEAIAKWMARGKYAKLLALWVKGATIDWLQLYPGRLPRRLSLPTYPFAKLRCWLDSSSFLSSRSAEKSTQRRLHPLLHENTSNLDGPRFSSCFSGQEFWLADHVVHGRPVLPGVAYLEMARAAIVHGSAREDAAVAGIILRDVVWVRPLFVDGAPVRVHVALAQQTGEEIGYEIYSDADPSGRVIHAQGRASWRVPEPSPRVNLAALQAAGERRLAVNECYELMRVSGLTHGPALRGLREAVAGVDEAGSRFVLARLELPESVKGTASDYVLHPSLLDSALHAAGALDSRSAQQEPLLLYAVESVAILAAPTAASFAVLREDVGSSAQLPKVRIELCDELGNVCVRVSGLSARRLDTLRDTATQRTVYLSRQWTPATAAADRSTFSQRWIFGSFADAAQAAQWSEVERRLSALPQTHVERLTSQAEAEHDRYEQLGWQLIEGLQRILASKPHGPVLVQVVTSDARRDGLLQGLGGVLKTAQMENPLIRGQLVCLQGDDGAATWIEQLQHASGAPEAEIRYRDGVRQVSEIAEDTAPPEQVPWKSGGIYLVTGGAGGLGLTFAEEIIQRVADAHVILVGRSPLSADKARRLRAWADAGLAVDYRQVDCADAAAVTALIADIRAAHGRLDGVIHAAGALRDSFLLAKTRQEYEVVLGAKVRAAVNLDAAIGSRALDFFVLFSSITGSTGNIGQADYAAANGFLDAYAQYRRGQVDRGERHGRTLSIAWPLWADGGMRMSGSGLAQLRAEGYQALQNPDGVAAFYRAFGSDASCIIVVRRDVVTDTAAARTAPAPVVPDARGAAAVSRGADSSARAYLQRLLAAMLKLQTTQLEPGAPFSRYGLDSIVALRLTTDLEKIFGPLPKTLFFEYPNFEALYRYFDEAHSDALQRALGPAPEPAAALAPIPELAPRDAAVSRLPVARSAAHAMQTASAPTPVGESLHDSAIAIIGLSGRYPQARTVEALWEKLSAGEDCVTPIPAERWDGDEDYDERKGVPGKSYGKWGGFLLGVDEFDPLFFGLSPREAEYTDPQQR
ncbi:SDR family NAD(P)-dependent oxidoreductase, partial [Tahibacter sp.]|uniref:SDR family NAD(P)-dependent oxidoreductase n=1 Tax=Tahibacter sp. TaxID=2056211 RepID=UPI0028C4EA5C